MTFTLTGFSTFTIVEDYPPGQGPQNAIPLAANPQPGAVPMGTEVTLYCLTDNSNIFYTTDGTDPTEDSALYTGPIPVTGDVTIKAIAVSPGKLSSDIAEFTCTVNDILVKPVITITTAQPQDVKVTEGSINSSLTISAAVTPSETVSYQWFQRFETQLLTIWSVLAQASRFRQH